MPIPLVARLDPVGGGGGGEGRGGMSEEVKTLGEALSLLNYRLPRTVKN